MIAEQVRAQAAPSTVLEERPSVAVSVVIPVHNEEEAIAGDLDTIVRVMGERGEPYEIIVVDDGSTDRTAEIIAARPEVRLLRHPVNRGTGAALKTGINAAHGDIIIMTDGDGTYPNHEMPRMLALMDKHDMVVGARRREMGTLPLLRRPAKAFLRLLASYLTGTRIPDLNSGLRCFKKEIALQYFSLLPSGHSWVSTITLAFLSNGYSVYYLPVDYYARKGRSHFHPINDTYNYLSLIVRTIMYFDPLRFFLPFAASLLLIGGVKTVADIINYNFHIATGTVMLVLTAVQITAIGLLADLVVKRSRLL